MGFLTRAAKGQEQSVDMKREREQLYERLFPKIGRDFVTRRDFFIVIEQILDLIDSSDFNAVDYRTNAGARNLALEYKDLLDRGVDGSNIYKDLINLDEDEDDYR